MGLYKEFKTFIMKGNVLDLAIAVIIGGAFGKIVASLVNDIIMPPIGLILGKVDFKNLKVVIQSGKEAVMNGTSLVTPAVSEVSVNYGMFIQNTFDFLLIALCIFLVLKVYQKVSVKETEKPAPAKPSNEEKLLTEIRDLLKNK
ncbi:MAG: large-conductance mechanosensitive channel protein MscL [Ignavibacteriae bacterium]|jgi:large conductance mechanosensitive channel|nr:large-conductance mechanosensitive channel protein MscL [Ignavibacteriota bacterium]